MAVYAYVGIFAWVYVSHRDIVYTHTHNLNLTFSSHQCKWVLINFLLLKEISAHFPTSEQHSQFN